jgi:chorismate synthase
VAEKWLQQTYGVEIVAFDSSVGNINLFDSPADALSSDPSFLAFEPTLTRARVGKFLPVRCPHPDIASKMEGRIAELHDAHHSTGGTVTCIIRDPPSGLGEPCFDKLEATLAHAIMSIPAVKGFETGSGSLAPP